MQHFVVVVCIGAFDHEQSEYLVSLLNKTYNLPHNYRYRPCIISLLAMNCYFQQSKLPQAVTVSTACSGSVCSMPLKLVHKLIHDHLGQSDTSHATGKRGVHVEV